MYYYSLLISIIIFLGFVEFTISDNDCLYNKCDYRLLSENQKQFTTHVPCQDTGNRQLVRSVDCDGGLTYHICCIFPFRQDVQKSRQKWFRFVTKSGSKISPECTKRILCEQSCLDGLSGDARSDFPQVLNDDNEENKEYVAAYNKGENQACYGQSAQKSSIYNSTDCIADCNSKYNECENDLESSYLVNSFYLTSRAFHKVGMWTFSAWWLMKDTIEESYRKYENVKKSVKQGAEKLYKRMDRMMEVFEEWAKTEDGNRNKRSILETKNNEKKWVSFMPVYNKTDPNLVGAVNESLSYNQFTKSMNIINETLFSYDFGLSSAFDFFLCGIHFRVLVSVLAVIFPFLISD